MVAFACVVTGDGVGCEGEGGARDDSRAGLCSQLAGVPGIRQLHGRLLVILATRLRMSHKGMSEARRAEWGP